MEHKTGLEDFYVIKNNKKLRMGYTTGSCAAGAAKGAAEMVLSGSIIREISLMTPKGILLHLELHDITMEANSVTCAVRKQAGDDPDTTDGVLVYAKVERISGKRDWIVDGGIGVGRVTKPGLSQKVGEAAINPVPHSMICRALEEAADKYQYEGNLKATISVPDGEKIAAKTFNPRLGIKGGISILGTSGIVEPMSEQALTQTIFLEMKMLRDEGHRYCYLTPGNYGNDFLRQTLGYDQELAVKCSNYIGDAIDDGVRLKMDGLLLVGHIGKLVKIAAGVMNTHSRQADARMEVLAVHAAMAGADRETVCALMKCFTTKEALDILEERGLLEETMRTVMEKIEYHLAKRAGEKMKVGALMFSDELGILGKTSLVDKLREKIG